MTTHYDASMMTGGAETGTLPQIRRSGASVASVSVCSDLREMNEAKVQGILNYLEDVERHGADGGSNSMRGSGELLGYQQHFSGHFSNGGGISLGQLHQGSLGLGAKAHSLSPTQSQSAASIYQDSIPVQNDPRFSAHSAPLMGSPAGAAGRRLDPVPSPLGQRGAAVALHPIAPSSYTTVSEVSTLQPVDGNSVYHGLKGKIVQMKSEIVNLKVENESLKHTLNDQRLQSETELRSAKRKVESESEARMQTLEKEVKKHLQCIKGLVQDKEQLLSKVDTLNRENEKLKGSRDEEIKAVERKHAAALNECKAKMEASEKAKREAWAAKEGKKIKETLIKAMEPDLARQISRHREELKRMEAEHQETLKRRDELLRLKDIELSEVRTKAGKELEEQLLREREQMRQRLTEESDRTQRRLEEQRRSAQDRYDDLSKELQIARDDLRAAQKRCLDLQHDKATLEHSLEERLLLMIEKTKQEKEHEVLELKNELLAHRRGISDKVEKEHAELLRQREVEIQKQCELQRDQAIQKVITRLEADYVDETNRHREVEKSQREELTTLNREIERLKGEVAVLTEQRQNALEVVRQKEREAETLRSDLERLLHQRSEVEQRMEREFGNRLKTLDAQWSEKVSLLERQKVAEIGNLQAQIAVKEQELQKVKLDSDLALRALEQQQHVELSAINDRVLVTISKKEQSIRQLTERCQALESALQQRTFELQRHIELLDGE